MCLKTWEIDLEDPGVLQAFDAWTDRFASSVASKGKVPPGRFRACGYEAPGQVGSDMQLFWRDPRMRAGFPPQGSSPHEQQRLGLIATGR